MKKSGVIWAVIAVIVVGGGVTLALTHKTKKDTSATGMNMSTSDTSMLSSTSMSPSFTITANDSSADHEKISVKKGANVSLMFVVKAQGTYHGGLQFVSTDPAIDSGPIAPGNSKTVTFTASKSFTFQPYWYASQVKKDYLITVNVTE